ncbi:MAG: gamma-glutamylcyclotransferase [Deltaproteobacteria bacterium]|nr:gamma-glutamylcyclotransferase [Deltaproteobacteria bacterium]
MIRHRQLLFCYGTLRRGTGHELSLLLERREKYLGRARFEGVLYDMGSYPAALSVAGSHPGILGDVYALYHPGEVLDIMDRYEGCTENDIRPHEYRREKHAVRMEPGGPATGVARAWVYVLNRDPGTAPRIEGGDYLSYLGCLEGFERL